MEAGVYALVRPYLIAPDWSVTWIGKFPLFSSSQLEVTTTLTFAKLENHLHMTNVPNFFLLHVSSESLWQGLCNPTWKWNGFTSFTSLARKQIYFEQLDDFVQCIPPLFPSFNFYYGKFQKYTRIVWWTSMFPSLHVCFLYTSNFPLPPVGLFQSKTQIPYN